jgi:lysophospholipase L1-like esterase
MIRRLIYFSFLVVILFVVSTACATQTPPQPEANQSPKREESVEPTIEQEPESTTEDNDSLQIEETSTPSVSDDKVNYDQYFTNSVFVGDSVMEGFAQYVRGQRNSGVDMLSNAQFLTSLMGISVYDVVNATTDAKCYFTYRGKEQPLETILQEMGVNRVFIMLGMNDIANGFSTVDTTNNYRNMIDLIKNTNPNLDIVVLTPTPKTASKWLPDYTANRNFGSPLLNELADMIKTMCQENGIKVIDVNAAVRGPDGHLPDEYSRDNFVHINNECSAIILDFIMEFAKIQLEG